MLTIDIINLGTGTNESANYKYLVLINGREIDRGYINGHNRDDGWQELVKMVVKDSIDERKVAVVE